MKITGFKQTAWTRMKIKTTNYFINKGSSFKSQQILIYCQIRLEYRPKSDQVKKIQRGSEREPKQKTRFDRDFTFLLFYTQVWRVNVTSCHWGKRKHRKTNVNCGKTLNRACKCLFFFSLRSSIDNETAGLPIVALECHGFYITILSLWKISFISVTMKMSHY